MKAYRVNASSDDGYASAMLVADGDPLYWEPGEASASVTAWWPCSDGQQEPPAVRVGEDQRDRERFEQSDLIVAGPQTVTPIRQELRFTHRTALVHIVLTDYTEGLESVRLTGLSTRDGNPAEIFPYDEGGYTYSALVAPQEVAAGTAFIACTFDSGKTFAYRMQNTAEWLEGKEYTYTVSLAAADPGYTYDDATHTYIVYNADGLQAWGEAAREDLTLNCTLIADITLPEVAEKESNWTPVGNDDNYYIGTFEGGDHTITGLTIYLPNQDYVGLFGMIGQYGTVGKGTVQHLTLAGVEITGNYSVGGVVGYNYKGTLTDCSVSGNVSGVYNVGGVAGYNSGTLTDCSATGYVTGTGDYVGGVVGCSWKSTLTACTFSGDVTGTSNYVGGVAGYSYGTVTGCYATGDVSGRKRFVGGVAGANEYGSTLTGCYHAAGDVSGNNSVGGVAGYNKGGTLTGCYWRNNLDAGVGDNEDGSIEVTKVDGTAVTWVDAVAAMNTALQNAGSSWQYELKDDNSLPVLKEEQ